MRRLNKAHWSKKESRHSSSSVLSARPRLKKEVDSRKPDAEAAENMPYVIMPV